MADCNEKNVTAPTFATCRYSHQVLDKAEFCVCYRLADSQVRPISSAYLPVFFTFVVSCTMGAFVNQVRQVQGYLTVSVIMHTSVSNCAETMRILGHSNQGFC